MPSLAYLLSAIAIAGVITLLLRSVPFAILKPLRQSKFVQSLGRWMPAGILCILAIVVLRDEIAADLAGWWRVAVATGVTVAVHLLLGRRALLSIAVGTATYIGLLAWF